jgi:Zn-dependent protease with chaperone function
MVAFLVYQVVTAVLRIITILLVFWFIRKRELKADYKGAKMVGYDVMIATLTKLLELEKKEESLGDFLEEERSKEDELGFEENSRQANDYQKEPNSISLLKFSTGKKKSD